MRARDTRRSRQRCGVPRCERAAAELLAERETRIAKQDAEIAVLREHLAGLQSQVADLAARVGAECGEVPGVVQEGEYSGELPDGDREDRGVADPEPGRDPRQALVDRFEESQQRPGHDDVQDDHDRERGYPEAEEPRGGEDVPGGSGWVAGGDQMLDDAEVY